MGLKNVRSLNYWNFENNLSILIFNEAVRNNLFFEKQQILKSKWSNLMQKYWKLTPKTKSIFWTVSSTIRTYHPAQNLKNQTKKSKQFIKNFHSFQRIEISSRRKRTIKVTCYFQFLKFEIFVKFVCFTSSCKFKFRSKIK